MENLNYDVKTFADPTSLFSVVKDQWKASDEVNSDLERVRLRVWLWKMDLNANKTEEIIFSSKRLKPTHPPLFLGGNEVTVKAEHKQA